MKISVLATAMIVLLSSTAFANPNGSITKVTLSSGGLAQITRKFDVPPSGLINMNVQISQLDDLLKSLIVEDGDSQINGMTMNGPNQAEEVFKNNPFKQADLASLSSLLEAAIGSNINISGQKEIGTIVNVEVQKLANGQEKPMLTIVWSDNSISSVPVMETKFTLVDPKLRDKMAEGLRAVALQKTDNSRDVEISLVQKQSHPVDLSYVVSAPIWKSAYRLLEGEGGHARLQAWSIFENTSGEDWHDVEITLSSGKPQTLRQQLLKHFWTNRPEIEMQNEAPVPPMERDSAVEKRVAAPQSPLIANPMMLADKAPSPISMASGSQEMSTTENETSTNFTIPHKISLKQNETISMPMIDEGVKAETVSIFTQGQTGDHPEASVILSNDSGMSFPAGILTVYDKEGGYIGDAKMENFPKGKKQTIGFATDQKIKIRSETSPEQSVENIKIVDGVITFTSEMRTKTTYKINGASDAERTVVLQQPHVPGSVFDSKYKMEENNNFDQVKVDLKTGENKNVEVIVKTNQVESFGLENMNLDTMQYYLSNVGDPSMQEKLKKLVDARRKYDDANREVKNLSRFIEDILKQEQAVRENIKAVPAGEDQGRYVTKLRNLESQLDQMSTERSKAINQVNAYEKAQNDLIRTF